MPEPVSLLSARGLTKRLMTEAGTIRPSRSIDLDIYPGEVVGLFGESGSGKSVTGRAMARLATPPCALCAGSVSFRGRD